jgi:hypothetical protein
MMTARMKLCNARLWMKLYETVWIADPMQKKSRLFRSRCAFNEKFALARLCSFLRSQKCDKEVGWERMQFDDGKFSEA